jgi:Right handed beta helix region
VCRGGHVSFEGVRFTDCCLVAVDGADVAAADCAFRVTRERGLGLSLFAHGRDTAVRISESVIDGGVQSAAVHGGATLSAEGLVCSGATFAGVVIRDDGTRLELAKCAVRDMRATHDGDLNSCHGICVMGGDASVTNTSVVSGQCGLHVSKGRLVAEDCTFAGAVYSCVKVAKDGDARLIRCEMARSQRKHGLSCDGCPCTVEVQFCRLLDNKQRGVVVHDGASVNLMECVARGNGAGGFCAQSKWSTLNLRLRDCTSEGDGEGCRVSGSGAACVAENLAVSSSAGHGIHIFDGAAAELENCAAEGCGKCGVRMARCLSARRAGRMHAAHACVCAGVCDRRGHRCGASGLCGGAQRRGGCGSGVGGPCGAHACGHQRQRGLRAPLHRQRLAHRALRLRGCRVSKI